MPTRRKQKRKARKSRGDEMLSDIENIDVMLGANNFEKEESQCSNSVRGDPKVQATMLWLILNTTLILTLEKLRSRVLPVMAFVQEGLNLVVNSIGCQ